MREGESSEETSSISPHQVGRLGCTYRVHIKVKQFPFFPPPRRPDAGARSPRRELTRADADSFPSPQFMPGAGQAYGSDKLPPGGGSMPNSPNRIPYHEQRPGSTAPSWRSGGYSAHGRAPSDYHASVSSLSSSGQHGGLHLMYNNNNQQRPPHTYLNAVSEMDSVDAQRLPPNELSASPALPHRGVGDHVYGPGYSKIATREDT